MKSLLVVDSSGRVTRSITRHLTSRFAVGWRSRLANANVVMRDVGLNPPPPVSEDWIAAVFHDPSRRTQSMREALAESETLIAEIESADAIVLGVPMYNFGMPAALKAYFDQIVRVGRTFSFDAAASEPYRPLLASRPVIVVTSTGDGSLHPGGPLAHLNFLEPHVKTILSFVGLSEVTVIRAGYDEFQDDRARRSLRQAEQAVDEALGQLLGQSAATNAPVQSVPR